MKILDKNILGKNTPVKVFMLGLAGIAFVGTVDHLTGIEMAFSVFYLLPISAGAWFAGRKAGAALSFASAGAWLYLDLAGGHVYSNQLIPFWNAAVRLGFFIIQSMLLSSLHSALDASEALSRTDPLTGAANPRSFSDTAELELERMRRAARPLSLVYMDVDNFKIVNDTLGHREGDRLLRAIVDVSRGNLRDNDVVARLGGDEFAFLLPETVCDGAAAFVERLRARLLDEVKRQNWPVTFSFGLACFTAPPKSVDEMIAKADELMYSVKNSGKNRIETKVF